MPKNIISEGKTTAEAIEKGLKELKLSKDMVDIKVLEEGDKRSFYSILAPRIVKVELTEKECANSKQKKEIEKENLSIIKKEKRPINNNKDEIEKAVKSIEKFLNKFLKNGINHEIEVIENQIHVNINGENINYLIGYRGDTINALQVIVSSIANKESTAKISVYVDVAGYRKKRIKTLEDLADKIAKTVIRKGKSITLEPMTAYERKIIHYRLQQYSNIKTFSKGEEPYRKVVISIENKD